MTCQTDSGQHRGFVLAKVAFVAEGVRWAFSHCGQTGSALGMAFFALALAPLHPMLLFQLDTFRFLGPFFEQDPFRKS